MSGRKFSRQRSRLRGKKHKISTKNILIPVKQHFSKNENNPEIKQEYSITPPDRITYIYQTNQYGIITKVVNVCYDIEHKGEWITIVRFDSEHGYMHCHLRVSVQNSSEILTPLDRVIKKGTPHDWLTWAIEKDIMKQFLNYRKSFFKRSGIKDVY